MSADPARDARMTAAIRYAVECSARERERRDIANQSADPFVTKRDPFAYHLDPEVYAQGAKLAGAFNAGGWYRVEAHGRPPAGQAPAVDAEQVAEAFGFEVVDDLSCLPANPSEPAAGPLRCAYDRCQAGGVILDGAPRLGGEMQAFHPGCWAAKW